MNDEKATTTTTGFGARGAKAPPPSQEQGGKSPPSLKMFAGIEEKPSPSKGLESLFPPRPSRIFRPSYGPAVYCMEK